MTRTRLADMLTLTDDRLTDTFASYRLFDGVLGERDRAALSAAGRACLALAAKFPPQAYLAALVALVLVLTLTLLPALLPAFLALALVAGLWGVLRAARQAMAEADLPVAGVAAPVMCYSAGQWIACYLGADVPAPAAVPVGGDIVVPAGRLAAPRSNTRFLVLARCGSDDVPLCLCDTIEDAVATAKTTTREQVVWAAEEILDVDVHPDAVVSVGYVRFFASRPRRYHEVAVPLGIVVPPGRLAAPAAPEAPAAEAYYDATFDDGYCPECARTIATLDTTANLTPVSYAALRVRWYALRPENDVCAHCYRHLDPARRDAITVPPAKLAAPSDESPRWLTADLAGQRVLLTPLGHEYWRDEREAISRWANADPNLAAFAATTRPDDYPLYAEVMAPLMAEAIDRANAESECMVGLPAVDVTALHGALTDSRAELAKFRAN